MMSTASPPRAVSLCFTFILAGGDDPLDLRTQVDRRANSGVCCGLCHDVGITTVRDLGDRDRVTLRLREEIALRPDTGPHLLVSGPPITTARGHCWLLGGAPEALPD
jgi:hypothetical protein